MHQLGAVLIISSLLYMNYRFIDNARLSEVKGIEM